MSDFVKPARIEGEKNEFYLLRIMVAYGTYLYKYYNDLKITSPYLEKFVQIQMVLSLQPGHLPSVYWQLVAYVKQHCAFITDKEKCLAFIEDAIREGVKQEDIDKILFPHVTKFADMFWLFCKHVNLA